jgi:hypothetical protein
MTGMAISRRVRRSWFRALGIGPALMLIALLPSVLYIDHWTTYVSGLLGQSEEAQLSELASHSTHCHAGPSTCSDQPALYTAQVFPTVVEVDHPELPAVLLEDGPTVLQEHTSTPLTEPPRV